MNRHFDKICSLAIVVFLSLFSLVGMNVLNVKAQQASFWAYQEKIPDYEIYNNEQPPYLIADHNHTIHAFNAQRLDADIQDAPKAIMYRRWTLGNGWTKPNDILFDASGGNLELLGASSDQEGFVHLIFQENNGDIYYTNSLLADANNALAWSTPLLIAKKSLLVRPGIPNVAAITNDESGQYIYVVYSGMQYGNGLYFTSSSDRGNSWSVPIAVDLTADETLVVVNPKLYVSRSGFLHLVWSTFMSSGFGGPGYYAQYNPQTGVWSEPFELDSPGIRTPSVYEYDTTLYISYYHHSTNSNWWRRSADDGKTWTYPSQLFSQFVGTNGGVSFVEDSNNTLHAFFGKRINISDTHGMWHTIWKDGGWTYPEAVVSGPQILDVEGGEGFDPTFANAVVSNGNLMFVTWGTDGVTGTNGAWYSYRLLDTPQLPVTPLPTSSVLVVDTIPPTMPATLPANIDPVPTASNPLENIQPVSSVFNENPQIAFFLGIIPILLLLFGVFVIRARTRPRKNK